MTGGVISWRGMRALWRGLPRAFLPRTLFGRSLLIVMTPILLIQIVSPFLFFDRHWTKMTGRLAVGVAGEISFLVDRVEADPLRENFPETADIARKYFDIDPRWIPGGRLDPEPTHYSIWEPFVSEIFAAYLYEKVRRPLDIMIDREEKWIRVRIALDGGVLELMVPQGRLFSSSGHIFLLWMTGISAVLLGVAVLFLRNQVRPIRKLAIAAERFGKGRDVAGFKPEGATEVRQAGRSFIEMRDRIRRQIEQRTAMLAGVSHDLRTPLTRMKLQTAMMGGGPDVEALTEDIRTMERMIGGYLDFVRGEGDEAAEDTDLGALAEKVVQDARRADGETEVSAAIEQGIVMPLRPLAIERCLTNLIGNARRHARSTVWVSVRRLGQGAGDGKGVEIVIDDDGPGIPENRYEDVFRPFYRVDSSRNIDTGGVGLGLPIARDIVHAHGGKITLGKSPQGGLRVLVELPE